MKLQSGLKDRLETMGIRSLNEMQESTYSAWKEVNDLVLLSPTGSGKTLAFLLPLIESLNTNRKGVQAMVLVPSRELALQIEQVFRELKTGFKVTCCYGGHEVRKEINALQEAPALVIGTPGRVADHLRRESFDPKSISVLVLDEFDKALELGFQKEMEQIISQMERLQKRVLTSATQAINIPDFVGCTEPLTLDYTAKETPKGLNIQAVVGPRDEKPETLFRLLCYNGAGNSIVFCNHREAVERISEHLYDMQFPHDVFHGGLKQEDRERALIKFRNGSHQTLIATDLAARGLDIPDLKHVIHYQLPVSEEAYIHRNGRTARMHAEGSAWLVLHNEEALKPYFEKQPAQLELPEDPILPPPLAWSTVYVGGGKKDKVNKVDIVGFFLQQGNLQKDELGLIEVKDHAAYVAVKRKKARATVEALRNKKLKRRKYKIAVSK